MIYMNISFTNHRIDELRLNNNFHIKKLPVRQKVRGKTTEKKKYTTQNNTINSEQQKSQPVTLTTLCQVGCKVKWVYLLKPRAPQRVSEKLP